MSRLCIDLGYGLGGASAAFRDSPDWEVVSIDIDRKFKPTIQADYSVLPLRDGIVYDEILAAPDCSCFSLASVYRYWEKGNPHFFSSSVIL